ncbi:MAG: CD225/dispanin family protein [Nocardioides sp.]|nr:CD225/dispanin family protein [Nocardioides sp.]
MSSSYPTPDQPDWGGAPPPGGSYPSYGGGGGGGTPPDNNLVWGILTTLFCCLPLGIVSIVNAAKVDALWTGGRHAEAQAAADAAKKWAIIAAITGVVIFLGYLLFVVAIGLSIGGGFSDIQTEFDSGY